MTLIEFLTEALIRTLKALDMPEVCDHSRRSRHCCARSLPTHPPCHFTYTGTVELAALSCRSEGFRFRVWACLGFRSNMHLVLVRHGDGSGCEAKTIVLVRSANVLCCQTSFNSFMSRPRHSTQGKEALIYQEPEC